VLWARPVTRRFSSGVSRGATCLYASLEPSVAPLTIRRSSRLRSGNSRRLTAYQWPHRDHTGHRVATGLITPMRGCACDSSRRFHSGESSTSSADAGRMAACPTRIGREEIRKSVRAHRPGGSERLLLERGIDTVPGAAPAPRTEWNRAVVRRVRRVPRSCFPRESGSTRRSGVLT
jgi:hypothetical protein